MTDPKITISPSRFINKGFLIPLFVFALLVCSINLVYIVSFIPT